MHYLGIGRVLIVWFNDYILLESSHITNLIITLVDSIPYHRIGMGLFCESIDYEH